MLDILLRVSLGFAVVLILIRLIGNKQLGQLNVFTYISGIVIGSMMAEVILHRDLALWESIFKMFVWVALTVGIELLSLKSRTAREWMDGQPIVLIKKGQIMHAALKKERLNIDDLTMLLRTNRVFSIRDVDYAILEPNGDLSVLLKQEKDAVTKEDMKVAPKAQPYLPTAIIMDGTVIVRNLRELGLSAQWLQDELEHKNIRDAREVFYAELQSDGTLYLQRFSRPDSEDSV